MNRMLVCGDRNWSNQHLLNMMLDQIAHEIGGVGVVIEGEATGADTMARKWADARKIPVLPYPAQWDVYGKAAGPIRNAQMLAEGKPTHVVAFHNDIEKSRGTKDMVARARKSGLVDIWVIQEP